MEADSLIKLDEPRIWLNALSMSLTTEMATIKSRNNMGQ